MNTDDLFGQLEPPPGGAERFARRLDEAAAHARSMDARRTFALAGAAAAVVLLVVALAVLRAPSDAPPPPVADSVPAPEVYPEIYDSPAFDRLLGRPLQAEQLTATVNQEAKAVTELESQNPNVRIYRIN
jgi:hypothetical protein